MYPAPKALLHSMLDDLKKTDSLPPVSSGAGQIDTPDSLPTTHKDSDIMADQTEKGTTELKEAISGAAEGVAAARRAGSDGWQVTDGSLVITDEDLRDAITEAIEGAQKIPGEVADLSFGESLDVGQHAVGAFRDAFGA
jgi:hypothetical protein